MAKGQHIFVRRPPGWMTRGILHHGIDLGDGTVIHFTGFTDEDARVFRMNMKAFERNGKAEIFPYAQICQFAAYEFGQEVSRAISRGYYDIGEQVPPSNVQPRSSEVVINEAFKWVGTTFLAKKYMPARNNCEHFATACATGYPFSLQVQYEKEFLQRRPSLGGLVAAIFTEWGRFNLNPRTPPKTEDGYQYMQTIYRANDGALYQEHYSKPGDIPPIWFRYRASSESGEQVDQTNVPYPLTELRHRYKNENGQYREEEVNLLPFATSGQKREKTVRWWQRILNNFL
ncbi:hypothetical protein NIES2107_60060 [Nostoc carneum NIES-2107]|nr:hypothetical protein NIES2107_60060 [Nostoc carneum NIES-2107]